MTNSPYGLAARDQELRELSTTPTGLRQTALNRAAFVLGQLVGGDELDPGGTADALLTVALNLGLHPREARSTIKRGLRDGARSPRFAPGSSSRPVSPPPPPLSDRLTRRLYLLEQSQTFPREWAWAQHLATLPEPLMRQDVLGNWDYITRLVDLPRLLSTATLLREVATLRFGWPDIPRLIEEIR